MADEDLAALKAELASLKKQVEESRATPKKKKKDEDEDEDEKPKKKKDEASEIAGMSESTGHAILERIKLLEEKLTNHTLRWLP